MSAASAPRWSTGRLNTYAAVRRAAPDAMVIANIGAAQLIPQPPAPAVGPAEAQRLVEMVRADALAVHLNFLEEAIQPEGDRRAGMCRSDRATVRRPPRAGHRQGDRRRNDARDRRAVAHARR